MLYEWVMENRELSKAAAMVCDKLANLDREGTRFRSTILSLLQVDYKGMLRWLLSLAGAATSVIFIATKHVFSHDKSMLVAIELVLCRSVGFMQVSHCH